MAARYAAAALVAVETLLVARVLGPDDYGEYALVQQSAAVLIALIGLGTTAGYICQYYTGQREKATEQYIAAATAQYCIAGVAILALLATLQPSLIASGFLILIVAPYWIMEPVLRVRNSFLPAVAGKAAASGVTIVGMIVILVVAAANGNKFVGLHSALVALVLGNLAGYGAYYHWLLRRWGHRTGCGEMPGTRNPAGFRGSLNSLEACFVAPAASYRATHVRFTKSDRFRDSLRSALRRVRWALRSSDTWRNYYKWIVRRGMPDTVDSMLFMGFTFIDRLFISRVHNDQMLGSYSLAWQIVQGALIMITSLTQVSNVRIGESLSIGRDAFLQTVRRSLKLMILVGIIAFTGIVITGFALGRTVFSDYRYLGPLTALIALGYFAKGMAGSVTCVMMYRRRNIQRVIASCLLIGASIIGNVAAMMLDLSYLVPLLISTAGLVVLSAWLVIRSYTLAVQWESQGWSNGQAVQKVGLE